MSEIVAAVASSHATAMKTRFDQTQDMERAQQFMAGLEQSRRLIEEARPDAVIVFGSNHYQGFFLDMMPAFAIGAGEAIGLGDGGSPEGPLPVDPDLARDLLWGLTDREFDIALSLRLELDHGITQCLQYLTPQLDVPIVPIVTNTFTPPLPPLKRCYQLGRAVRDIVEGDGKDKRIALLASGGLSHHLPFMKKWFAELGADEQVLVDGLFEHGPHEEWNMRRISIMQEVDEPFINEQFDREFLGLLEQRDWETILSYSSEQLEEVAGNASQEIRAWVSVAAAAGGPANTLSYAPMYEWHTGMGLATFPVA